MALLTTTISNVPTKLALFVGLFLILIAFGQTEDSGADGVRGYDTVQKNSELFTHIVKKEWALALRKLEEKPEEAFILIERRNQSSAITLRHMAIHQVFLTELPSDPESAERRTMLEDQLSLILKLIRLNPRALAQKDIENRTPLHLALSSPIPPPRKVIDIMLKIFPNAAKTRDFEERLPLHTAVSAPMTTFENVQAVLKANPSAIDVLDEDGSLPLHLAAFGGAGPDAMPVIKLLLETNPDSLHARDGDGETALMLMAKYRRTSVEAIRYMLEAHPSALDTDRDEHEGNTPLHHAVSAHVDENKLYEPLLERFPETAQVTNRVGKLPIHEALSICCAPFEMVNNLVKAFPQGVSRRDGFGMAPLHYACLVGISDDRITKLLLEMSPNVARIAAVLPGESKGPLPLHQALRAEGSEAMHRAILLLLKQYPEASEVADPDTSLLPLHTAFLTGRPISILKKLMYLTPDELPKVITLEEDNETYQTSAFHLFAAQSPSHLKPSEIRSMMETFLEMDPDGVKRKDSKGRLPLHVVWSENHIDKAQVASRQLLIDLLLEAFPDGATTLDDNGESPLLCACVARDAYAVDQLLRTKPEAIMLKSNSGSLPLHRACSSGKAVGELGDTNDIILNLLEKYPEAASERDNEGKLPLEHVSESGGSERIVPFTIQRLIDAFPEAVQNKNERGYLPLHTAVENIAECTRPSDLSYWKDLVRTLLDTYPEGAAYKYDDRNTAFSLCLQSMETLSHTRRDENDPILDVLKILYNVHPLSVREVDGRGRNALHLMGVQVGDLGGMTPQSWRDFVLRVMRENPELSSQADKNGRTPLHLFVLYLGDTAVGSREGQDQRTMQLIPGLEDILHTMIALGPEALEMKDEYDYTPLDLVNHERLSHINGSPAYKQSEIINMMRRLLQRPGDYWNLAATYEQVLNTSRAVSNEDETIKVCNETDSILTSLQTRLATELESRGIESACWHCSEKGQIMENIKSVMRLLGTAIDDLDEIDQESP